MYERPFKVSCSAISSSGAPDEFDVSVALREGGDPSRLISALHAVSDVGAMGGFAGEGFAPWASVAVLQRAPSISGQWIHASYRVTNVDRLILSVLINLAHTFHTHVASVETVALAGDLVKDSSAIPVEFPDHYEPCPFALEYNVEGAQVTVDADFLLRRDPADVTWLHDKLGSWILVAALGGFSDETFPPEISRIDVEEGPSVLSTGFGISLDNVAIADGGFHCLVNMCEWVHANVAPLESVVIE